MKFRGIIIESLRVLIAAPIGFWAAEKLKLSAALNILMFFVIYVVVALIIEGILRVFKKSRH